MRKHTKNTANTRCKMCNRKIGFKNGWEIFYGRISDTDGENFVATTGVPFFLCNKCKKITTFLTGLFKELK